MAESEPRSSVSVKQVVGARWRNAAGGIGQASWPLVRLRMDGSAVLIDGVFRPLTFFVPNLRIEWASIDRLEDAGWGVRIVQHGAPSVVILTWPNRARGEDILALAERLGVKVERSAKKLGWSGL